MSIDAPERPISLPPPPADDSRGGKVVTRPRRVAGFVVAGSALVVCALAVAVSAVGLILPDVPAQHIVIVPPAAPVYSAAETAAAKDRACTAWLSSSEAMARASNAVADAPPGWDNLETKDAIGVEARTALVQIAYLKSQVGSATPQDIAAGVHDYLVATVDQEEAAMRRMGSQVDAAIDRVNVAVESVNKLCGFA